MHRECTRRDRPASCGRRVIGGIPCPVNASVCRSVAASEEVTHVWRGRVALQVRFDGLVLFVELGQVGNEILDHVGVGQRIDAGLLGRLGRYPTFKSSVMGFSAAR